MVKLSNETLNAIGYFFSYKGLDRWSRWEREQKVILQELPTLKMYLDKEKELEDLRLAVKDELKTYYEKRSLSQYTSDPEV